MQTHAAHKQNRNQNSLRIMSTGPAVQSGSTAGAQHKQRDIARPRAATALYFECTLTRSKTLLMIQIRHFVTSRSTELSRRGAHGTAASPGTASSSPLEPALLRAMRRRHRRHRRQAEPGSEPSADYKYREPPRPGGAGSAEPHYRSHNASRRLVSPFGSRFKSRQGGKWR